jgi:hypothetical protein
MSNLPSASISFDRLDHRHRDVVAVLVVHEPPIRR